MDLILEAIYKCIMNNTKEKEYEEVRKIKNDVEDIKNNISKDIKGDIKVNNIPEDIKVNNVEGDIKNGVEGDKKNKISLKDYKYIKTKNEGGIIYIYMVNSKDVSDIIKVNIFDI